jgi:activator of 2-hydroxyglutaryl-CoA dehydratase/predicted nucleotide-binding protein (sugar kinase/HSP70/actin superfamily)
MPATQKAHLGKQSLTDSHRLQSLFIDAGINTLRIAGYDRDRNILARWELPSHRQIKKTIGSIGLDNIGRNTAVYITGKLREPVFDCLGHGEKILPAAALWAAAASLAKEDATAILEISASGYTAVGVNEHGRLKNDLLAANSRCGAGSGINLERVLQKLDISPPAVDELLVRYLGGKGESDRRKINVRTDRCGVFASSATVSDKNQGIPVDFALAVTLKSEVSKACQKIPPGFGRVWLTGGVFAWKFARDCARDALADMGTDRVSYDSNGELPIRGLMHLEQRIGRGAFVHGDRRVLPRKRLPVLPPFSRIEETLIRDHRYYRASENAPASPNTDRLKTERVNMGLDVGSTMAKMVISSGADRAVLVKDALSNAGDTIETVQALFTKVRDLGISDLRIENIGITGSARYQVQKTLVRIYPQLKGAVKVLVENYAHARGSIDYVRDHIKRLKAFGVGPVNDKRCILVDVGGEDTKISTIDLLSGDLFDNAMNIKCSAGTGSLLDVMASLFNIADIQTVSHRALEAPDALAINATCAVFLMENSIRMQSEGVSRDTILASAIWAIVENMAHSLWNQIDLPEHAVALLHGQTMLGVPLTLATAQRLNRFIGSPVYCLVPPDPGHRACLGLIGSMEGKSRKAAKSIRLDDFITQRFRRRIIQCHGVACGDTGARCNRSQLIHDGGREDSFRVTLGGCTAVNELMGGNPRKHTGSVDTYRQIWNARDRAMVRSDHPDRLVIPRSFAVSEWACFFSHLFTPLGIPVHVDNVAATDIQRAQSVIHIDTCAPHTGVVGQMMRLAAQPHGMILAPQIEFLPIDGNSLGRTCTINQGGMAVARNLALLKHPGSRIHLFYLSLKGMPPDEIAQQIYPRLKTVYAHYGVKLPFDQFRQLVNGAWQAQKQLDEDVADTAVGLVEDALDAGRSLALVVGREYILNPGIYDSHVGRLLRDKNMTVIPANILDIRLNPEFDHLYWRNAHAIATLVDAVAHKNLHRIVRHARMQRLFERIEKHADTRIALVQVSTFLCGPDSVTNPLINELVKKQPFLRIQSDATVQELAHLENRINTYIKQIQTGLHQSVTGPENERFDIKVLDAFKNRESLNPETDAIYLPTLSDNRSVTAVIRGAGFTCIDNYREGYDLQATITAGREVVGDGVCAPLAAVYGDILSAIEDFKHRHAVGDPQVKGKTRLLIFNNKGLGPCRQGQYVEAHKLFLNRCSASPADSFNGDAAESFVMNFLVGHENKGFNTGFPEWAYLRSIQGIILQGVLHQLLAEGASQCRDFNEYSRFMAEYRRLKKDLFSIQEKRLKPSVRSLARVRKLRKYPLLGWPAKYFFYRFQDRSLIRPLRRFTARWNRRRVNGGAIRIYIDGEVYMRVAQFEALLRHLIATLGYRQFHLSHTPVWGFLEYKLAGSMTRAKESIGDVQGEIRRSHCDAFRKAKQRFLRKKKRQLLKLTAAYLMQRYLIADPLYRAAGLHPPTAMPHVLEMAKKIIPTQRPGGELTPYVGEALVKLNQGVDLILNVAPEGCMVSSMGAILSSSIVDTAQQKKSGCIQSIFSQQGDLDDEQLAFALLKRVGPYRLYLSKGG